MAHITPVQLDTIQAWCEAHPQCRLTVGVEGIVTCDGMAVEIEGCGVIHPLSFLEYIDGGDLEPVDKL